MTTQPKSNNSDQMIDPKVRNINKLFVVSFKNSDDDPKRDSFFMVLHTTSGNQRP